VIVLDASAAIEYLLGTPPGARVAQRIGEDETVHAPHLLDLEVAQVLRRLVRGGELAGRRAEQAIAGLRDFAIFRYGHEGLLTRVWALRGSLTAYDAAYVALAESLGAPLLTRDARLARAGGHQAAIEVIG